MKFKETSLGISKQWLHHCSITIILNKEASFIVGQSRSLPCFPRENQSLPRPTRPYSKRPLHLWHYSPYPSPTGTAHLRAFAPAVPSAQHSRPPVDYLQGSLPHLHQVCSKTHFPARPTLTILYNMCHHHHPTPKLPVLQPAPLLSIVVVTYNFTLLFYCHYSTLDNVCSTGQWFCLLFNDVAQASRTVPGT